MSEGHSGSNVTRLQEVRRRRALRRLRRLVLVLAAAGLVVLLPVAWLLSQTGRLELVWAAFPIAELMSLTLSSIFLRRTLRSADARLKNRTAEAPAAQA